MARVYQEMLIPLDHRQTEATRRTTTEVLGALTQRGKTVDMDLVVETGTDREADTVMRAVCTLTAWDVEARAGDLELKGFTGHIALHGDTEWDQME